MVDKGYPSNLCEHCPCTARGEYVLIREPPDNKPFCEEAYCEEAFNKLLEDYHGSK